MTLENNVVNIAVVKYVLHKNQGVGLVCSIADAIPMAKAAAVLGLSRHNDVIGEDYE